MGALNIYKVDENKCQELIQALNEQMQSLDSLTINRQTNDEEVAFGIYTVLCIVRRTPTSFLGIGF